MLVLGATRQTQWLLADFFQAPVEIIGVAGQVMRAGDGRVHPLANFPSAWAVGAPAGLSRTPSIVMRAATPPPDPSRQRARGARAGLRHSAAIGTTSLMMQPTASGAQLAPIALVAVIPHGLVRRGTTARLEQAPHPSVEQATTAREERRSAALPVGTARRVVQLPKRPMQMLSRAGRVATAPRAVSIRSHAMAAFAPSAALSFRAGAPPRLPPNQ